MRQEQAPETRGEDIWVDGTWEPRFPRTFRPAKWPTSLLERQKSPFQKMMEGLQMRRSLHENHCPLQVLPLLPLLATRAETRLKSEHKPTAKALRLPGEKRDCLYIQGAAGPGYRGQQEPGRQAWKWILEVPDGGELGIKLYKATCWYRGTVLWHRI